MLFLVPVWKVPIRPVVAQVNFWAKRAVRISSHRTVRRNGVRFALVSISKMGHQTLLLCLSAVLRNVVVICRPLMTPGTTGIKLLGQHFSLRYPRA